MASSLPCGCGGVPFVSIIFRHFTNVGFGFSKTFGFLVISYISFLRVTFKIVPFKEGFLYTLLLAYLLINLAIFIKNKKEINVIDMSISSMNSKESRFYYFQEVLFSTGFLGSTNLPIFVALTTHLAPGMLVQTTGVPKSIAST